MQTSTSMIANDARAAYFILRLGAALAFLYPPVNAIFDPNAWIGYFPQFIFQIATTLHMSDEVLLHSFGIVELVIGLWILSGWRIFTPAIVATLMLVGIVVFNLGQFQIVFRDLSIAALTLGLAIVNRPHRGGSSQVE